MRSLGKFPLTRTALWLRVFLPNSLVPATKFTAETTVTAAIFYRVRIFSRKAFGASFVTRRNTVLR